MNIIVENSILNNYNNEHKDSNILKNEMTTIKKQSKITLKPSKKKTVENECLICFDTFNNKKFESCNQCKNKICKKCLSNLSRVNIDGVNELTDDKIKIVSKCAFCRIDNQIIIDITYFKKDELFKIITNSSKDINKFIDESVIGPLNNELEKKNKIIISGIVDNRYYSKYKIIVDLYFINECKSHIMIIQSINNNIINIDTMINTNINDGLILEDKIIYNAVSPSLERNDDLIEQNKYNYVYKTLKITKEMFDSNLINFNESLINSYSMNDSVYKFDKFRRIEIAKEVIAEEHKKKIKH